MRRGILIHIGVLGMWHIGVGPRWAMLLSAFLVCLVRYTLPMRRWCGFFGNIELHAQIEWDARWLWPKMGNEAESIINFCCCIQRLSFKASLSKLLFILSFMALEVFINCAYRLATICQTQSASNVLKIVDLQRRIET